jgi:hypothetical protein
MNLRFLFAGLLLVACADDKPAAGADASVGTADADPAAPDADPAAPDADPAAPDAAVLGEPFWQHDMIAAGEEFYTRQQAEGSVTRGVADPGADDGIVAELVFPGNPAFGNADRTSPQFASELATNSSDFHYGIYRMRVKLARCAPGEEVVNGLFTYFNDETDHDDDGIHDNSEIDIEILCGSPNALFMTVWTDYTFATETFNKWTRIIDLDSGDLWESAAVNSYEINKVGNDPSFVLPDFLGPDRFIEVGWEWRADKVRYFAVINGQERDLYTLSDAAKVPKLPGHIMFNVWHSIDHWFGPNLGQPPDYPAQDATMLVDWIRYWK